MTTLSQNVKVKVWWRLTIPLKVISFSYCQGHHTRNRNPIEHKPKKIGYSQKKYPDQEPDKKSPDQKSRVRTGPEKIRTKKPRSRTGIKQSGLKIQNTDRTEKIRTEKSWSTCLSGPVRIFGFGNHKLWLPDYLKCDTTYYLSHSKLSSPFIIKNLVKNLPMKQASNIEIISFLNFSSQIVKIENFWNLSDRSEHLKTTVINMPTSALNRKIQIWNSEIFSNNLLKMHNLEELHYPIKKFELFQRPNVKVKIFTFNDFSLISLAFIDIHRI